MAVNILILGVLAVVGIVVFLIVHHFRSRRAAAVTDAVCGRCGYNVSGLPTFTCPECGSDLRGVGIVTPGQRRPIGPWGRALLWTLILPAPALILSVAAAVFVLPLENTRSDKLTLASPPSGAYRGVELTAGGRTLFWPWERSTRGQQMSLQHVTIHLERFVGAVNPLEIDLARMAYRVRQMNGVLIEQSSGFDAVAVRDWMTDAGIDTANPQVQAEIQEICGAVQSAQTAALTVPQPLMSRGPGSWTGSVSGCYAGMLGCVSVGLAGFWLVIWLLGVWFCVWRKRPTS